MSSPLSDHLKQAIEEHKAETEKKLKNNVQIAMDNTEKRVKEKVEWFIQRLGVNGYYNEFTPSMYNRTFQLGKAVTSYTESFDDGRQVGFDFGAKFNEDLMDHSVYYLTIRYKHRKDAGEWTTTYLYHDDDPDEAAILANFRAGEHPNTGVNNGPIWMQGRIGFVPDEIRKWVKNGFLAKIFKEEMKKLTG